MDNEPLLSPSPSSSLFSRRTPTPLTLPALPEDNDISLPSPSAINLSSSLTPSELKEYLIFGPTTPSSDPLPDSSFNFSSAPLQAPDDWLVNPNIQRTKNHLHRSKTAPAMAAINEFDGSTTLKKEDNLQSQAVVRQAVLPLVLYLILGVVVYSCYKEHFIADQTHPVVDALYFCIVTMCTIGYGDITPSTTITKLFSIFFVLIGFGIIDIWLSGMVCSVLDLQESYLMKTINTPGNHDHDPGNYLIDFKKGRMRIRIKVGLALGVVVLCIGIGVAFMHFVERLNWLDSFYLSVMSVTTVGYGDRAFSSTTGRLFASIWLLVSTLAVARAFLYLTQARADKRHRRFAKRVLDQRMTVSQFLAADIDNNGFVSKSEYVIYKLKEMGKVSEKDVLLVCKQFERLDSGNCGKITLADLMEAHH